MVENRILSHTQSLCPICLRVIPAVRLAVGDDVFMEKTCPEHAGFRTLIWRGLPSYDQWGVGEEVAGADIVNRESLYGCPYDCGLCSAHKSPTCTVLLEVTERCNLRCPVCFAEAGESFGADPTIGAIKAILETLIDSGGPVPLQLSGGEPTVRDDLPQIVAFAKALGFGHVQINTNGVRIAHDRDYLKKLQAAGADLIYLQMDGVSDEVNKTIRGAYLARIKLQALSNCVEVKIGVQLVPTIIRGVNDHEIGAVIDLAKSYIPVVKGVHFQPISYFGRYNVAPSDEHRETIPDLLRALETQTAGEIGVKDFAPRRQRDAHCGFSAFYILNEDGRLKPTTRFRNQTGDPAPKPKCSLTPAEHVRRFITERSRYQEESKDCGCKSSNCTSSSLERWETHGFSISGMPFMDVWTVDLERLRGCCVHTAKSDGRIIPFCANYLTSASGIRLSGMDMERTRMVKYA